MPGHIRAKKELKQHFTDAKPINQLMCHLLGSVQGKLVLEPSVGHGAFLGGLMGQPARIDAIDIDGDAIDEVKRKFSNSPINVFVDDFIDIFVNGLMSCDHPVRNTIYDCVIANPPYGLYFEPSYRKQIKKLMPGFYARESYGIFLALSLSLLRTNGRYVFILPDTFLTSTNHSPLRSIICREGAPSHIIRFSPKLFKTVNFAYGNMCIIAGNKNSIKPSDEILWLDDISNDSDLNIDSIANAFALSGEKFIKNAKEGWSKATLVSCHLNTNGLTLGDIADCKTGIYTGDNEKYLGFDPNRVAKRLNGHAIEWNSQVFEGNLMEQEKLHGIQNDRKYVQIIRGGHRSIFEKTQWAIDWSPEAINFYATNKKARLQNSQYYFKKGISVPMVTTKRISASYMENAVFDQGVVGIFPHNLSLIPPLLMYLNSSVASKRIKEITNNSANNSANYIKRLPVPDFSEDDIAVAVEILNKIKSNPNFDTSVFDEFVSSRISPSKI